MLGKLPSGITKLPSVRDLTYALDEQRKVGRIETGVVYEQAVQIEIADGGTMRLRRIEVHLDHPLSRARKLARRGAARKLHHRGATQSMTFYIFTKRSGRVIVAHLSVIAVQLFGRSADWIPESVVMSEDFNVLQVGSPVTVLAKSAAWSVMQVL